MDKDGSEENVSKGETDVEDNPPAEGLSCGEETSRFIDNSLLERLERFARLDAFSRGVVGKTSDLFD